MRTLRLERLLFLMYLTCGIHGERAVELPGESLILQPLDGGVQKAHVLVFPNQTMRRARDMNEDLLGYRYEVTQEILNISGRNGRVDVARMTSVGTVT